MSMCSPRHGQSGPVTAIMDKLTGTGSQNQEDTDFEKPFESCSCINKGRNSEYKTAQQELGRFFSQTPQWVGCCSPWQLHLGEV